MKTLNNIIYFLFALIVLGAFANFAQNDYGFVMINLAQLFVGLILLSQCVINLSKVSEIGWGKGLYLSVESFLLGIWFLANFFKSMHWPGPSVMLSISTGVLFLLYFIYAIVKLVKDLRKGIALAFAEFFFILFAAIALMALTFKIMHWAGSMFIGEAATAFAILFILFGFIKRKYSYNGEKISLYSKLMSLSGRPVLVFLYFSIWTTYINLIILGIAPDFYSNTMSRPPAYTKMIEKGQNDKATEYWNNYEEFFQKRNR